MPRNPTRPLVLTLALVALLALSPATATAQSPGRHTLSSAEHSEPTLGLSQLWSLLSALWSETGSLLDPNGAGATTGSGAEPDAATTGDTGSLLDPDGRP
jgi:hypothetical protein